MPPPVPKAKFMHRMLGLLGGQSRALFRTALSGSRRVTQAAGRGFSRAAAAVRRRMPGWSVRRMRQGTRVHRRVQQRYPHREVRIDRGRTWRVVDGYRPGREIAEIKNTQLAGVTRRTARRYINSLRNKYPPGTNISDTPLNRANGIANTPLRGRHILEVPPQHRPIPPDIIAHARARNVRIRDFNGNILA